MEWILPSKVRNYNEPSNVSTFVYALLYIHVNIFLTIVSAVVQTMRLVTSVFYDYLSIHVHMAATNTSF